MAGASKVLQQIADTDVRVESYSYEGEDGHWLYTAPGWQWEDVHVIHEYSVRAVLREIPSLTKCEKGCPCGWDKDEAPVAKPQDAQVIPFRKES